jgi:nucleotide-binding universal stress UspA family protein
VSRILLATDGSPGADEALRFLIELGPRPDDVVHVISAAEHLPLAIANGERAEDLAVVVSDVAVARLRYAGCAAIAERAEGAAPRAIAETAVRIRADLIVLGSRGRGRWTAALLGSTARAVIHTTWIPTLVVRGQAAAPQRILLAASDIPGIRSGARALARLPWPVEAAIDVLAPPASGGGGTPHLAEVFDEAVRTLPGIDLRAHLAGPGPLGAEVHRYAEQLGVDLIVLSLALGGERLADDVVGTARCPVLVVPVPAAPARVREPAGDLAIAT